MIAQSFGREMSAGEITEYLSSRGHGVLSLASEGAAYSLPMAYGYDADGERFVMEFLSENESEKAAFVTGTETASLCVYTWEGRDDWYSVVATGPIERIDDDERIRELGKLLATQARDVAPWWLRVSSKRARERAWYLLDATSVTGYRSR